MILSVDPADPTPVYQQIRTQVERMVASGALAAGGRLPTIRQLATDLGVAKGTVAKAYEALLHDGIVTSAGRHGTVVAMDRTEDPAARSAGLHDAARDYAVRVRQLDVDPGMAVDAFEQALEELAQPGA